MMQLCIKRHWYGTTCQKKHGSGKRKKKNSAFDSWKDKRYFWFIWSKSNNIVLYSMSCAGHTTSSKMFEHASFSPHSFANYLILGLHSTKDSHDSALHFSSLLVFLWRQAATGWRISLAAFNRLSHHFRVKLRSSFLARLVERLNAARIGWTSASAVEFRSCTLTIADFEECDLTEQTLWLSIGQMQLFRFSCDNVHRIT